MCTYVRGVFDDAHSCNNVHICALIPEAFLMLCTQIMLPLIWSDSAPSPTAFTPRMPTTYSEAGRRPVIGIVQNLGAQNHPERDKCSNIP